MALKIAYFLQQVETCKYFSRHGPMRPVQSIEYKIYQSEILSFANHESKIEKVWKKNWILKISSF